MGSIGRRKEKGEGRRRNQARVFSGAGSMSA
jgi:hypothetical protein